MKTKKVYCKDGTSQEICIEDCPQTLVAIPPPCENHGGLDNHIIKGLTTGERWAFFVGLTLLSFYFIHKSGALKRNV